MTYKTYKDLSKELIEDGYIPLGRYEHAIDTLVLYKWFSPEKSSLIVECHTDDLGNAVTVSCVYSENLL